MSLTTTRRRSAKATCRSVAYLRPYSGSISPSFSFPSTPRALGQLHSTLYQHRLSSTGPSSSAERRKHPTETIPPLSPLAQSAKKGKVELHPAPIKPKPSDVFPRATPSGKEHVHKAPHSTHASSANSNAAQDTAQTHPHREGVIESAQHDFEAASSHGILAPPPPGAGKLQTMIHQAKEFFKFYWNGLKLINTNRVRVNRMRARVATGGPALTRWETKFVKTYKEDALKLIPFALIILIAEETIPLIVMWAPFLLPSTCVLPAQKERIAAKKRTKQMAHAEAMKDAFAEILKRSSSDDDLKALLGETGAKAISGLLGQSSYTFGLPSLRLRRIQKHLNVITEDDTLLLQEGLGERLTDAELREALEERGILADGLTPKQWKSRLQWWLTNVNISKTGTGESVDPIHQRVLLIARSGAGKF